jgi:hypothetical protein
MGMAPSVSVGHSSGEITAAYTAGLLSTLKAILAAYYHGHAIHEHSGQGSMLAVRLGVDTIGEYLAPYAPEQLCVAYKNSPSSITLSGMLQYVRKIKEKSDNAKVLTRELKIGQAYHSPHMAAVSAAYNSLLARALATLNKHDLRWRHPRSAMISSVTGQPVDMAMDSLPPSYWSDNLRSRVLFGTKDSGKDTEFWLHKGIMNIARVVPNHQLNTEWAPPASLASHISEVKQPLDGVRLKSSIVDGQLSLTYNKPEPSSALRADEIEIQVLASELQTTPNSPVVVSGCVLRRGSSVRADVAAGDLVIGWTTKSLTTVIQTACYIRLDPSINSDMTTILASVAALSKAVNMCITTTSVSSTDQILALPGPTPTLHALVRLGKAMQWDVSLVIHSPEEQQEYIS